MHITSISRSPPCNDIGYIIMKKATRLGYIMTYRYFIMENRKC